MTGPIQLLRPPSYQSAGRCQTLVFGSRLDYAGFSGGLLMGTSTRPRCDGTCPATQRGILPAASVPAPPTRSFLCYAFPRTLPVIGHPPRRFRPVRRGVFYAHRLSSRLTLTNPPGINRRPEPSERVRAQMSNPFQGSLADSASIAAPRLCAAFWLAAPSLTCRAVSNPCRQPYLC